MSRAFHRLVIFACLGVQVIDGARLKDLAHLEGARENQLIGYGLVVGLAGTGDKRQTVFSAQTVANLLQKMGVSVTASAIQVRNTAAVMLTANLPAYAQQGTRIDVIAAALGDATNLQGGILLMAPLKGADGATYAVAQGPVVTGGFVAGRGGNTQTVNHPTAGRLPNGAIVERDAPSPAPSGVLHLQLHNSDFTTAARVASAVNRAFPGDPAPTARAENAGLVSVKPPPGFAARMVEFMSALEALEVDSDRRSKVVVNERTGTVVLGKEVRIAPVSILHGGLTVEVRTSVAVSQPNPISSGKTTAVPQTSVNTKDARAKEVTLENGATIEDLVKALAAIGSTPRDVIAVLQNLRAAGALDAELEVI